MAAADYSLPGACLEVLETTLGSVSVQWRSGEGAGWYEFPTQQPSSQGVDGWSTAQALEIVSQCVSCLHGQAHPLTTATVEDAKVAITSGVQLLLAEVGHSARGGGIGSVSSVRGVAAEDDADTMGVVWCLRAFARATSVGSVLDLALPADNVSRSAEAMLHKLFASQGGSGGWSAYGGAGISTYATAMVVWAIAAVYEVFEPAMHLRPHKVHGTHVAIEWLLGNRIQGEGLPFFDGGQVPAASRTALTQIAIAARRGMITTERVRDADVFSMSAWLLKTQTQSGGWRDYAEQTDRLETEVTALAVLGLLRSGVSPWNPAVESAIKLLLGGRISDGNAVGWGLYVEPVDDDRARIWTTWCVTLALCAFLEERGRTAEYHGSFELTRSPRLVTVVEGATRRVRVRAVVDGTDEMWLYPMSYSDGPVAMLDEPSEPSKVTREDRAMSFNINGANAGVGRWGVQLRDVVSGETQSLVMKVICFGGVGRAFTRAAGDPQVLVASIAVAAGIYGIVRSGAAGSETAIAIATIGLLAVVILFVFAVVRQMFGD
jgi:hypothetical protein